MIHLTKEQQDFLKTLDYRRTKYKNGDRSLKKYIVEQKIDISHFIDYGFKISEILLYMSGRIMYREMFCFCGNKRIHKIRLKNNNIEIIGKYCSMVCRSSDSIYCNKISDTKTVLYSDPMWKEKTEKKKTDTCQARYQVDSPMQSVAIFNKHQDACFKKSKKLAGYEQQVLDQLENLFQYKNIIEGRKYLKDNNLKIHWLDASNKCRSSYPDFFIPELNTFIEVKSEYTRELGDYKIRKCSERLEEMGFAYLVCVYKKLKRRRDALCYESFNDFRLMTED